MDPVQHDLMDTSVQERREGRLIHRGEGEDSFFSAFDAIDADGLGEALDDDENLAQELQLQEVLMVSTKSTNPHVETGEPLGPSLPCCCVICERPLPSPEVFRAVTCSHALCRACLDQYIEAELQKDVSSVKCPRAGCDLVLEPEPYMGFVRPDVFDRWLDAHQRGDQRKSIVLVEPHPSVEQGEAAIFHVSIQGEFSRRDLLKLANTLLDAAAAPGDGPGNPKGKQPIIESPHPVTEIGQSSSASQDVDSEFYCAICMDPKPLHESFDINGCSHKFCTSCVRLYVTAKVGENSITIGCPDPACKDGNLEPEKCRSILPGEVFDRWGVALCESALGPAKFYCPYKDCSALLLNEGGNGDEQVMTDAECPHCKRVLCARCSVPWHHGINCEQFQQLEEDEKGEGDLMLRQLANTSRWQRCPECKIYVEKIEGCNFMSCRCGHCFCYVCASPMRKDNHYCNNCLGVAEQPHAPA
ncbi:E3 ubiquitin-protein ligase RNF19B-like [Phoenix dactylifera]|uniref:RBR-type E3 ubiquitin transferase n=1 Tax=Phoenix dactylifera TaxID=42345 RepID=A0A8B7CEH8_PHODC|nr:E3 ubiquitin-protein ligase RNF19B-like [Phoenix dactylifera]